jgi:hypothetical protein
LLGRYGNGFVKSFLIFLKVIYNKLYGNGFYDFIIYVLFISPGYIKALITELWSVTECGPIDITLFTPKSWPVDPIDRTVHKV